MRGKYKKKFIIILKMKDESKIMNNYKAKN